MFGARRRAVPLSDTGGMVYDEGLGLRRNVIYQKAWEVWVKAPLFSFLGEVSRLSSEPCLAIAWGTMMLETVLHV